MTDQNQPAQPDPESDPEREPQAQPGEPSAPSSGPLWSNAAWESGEQQHGQVATSATPPDPGRLSRLTRLVGTTVLGWAALLVMALAGPDTVSSSGSEFDRSRIWSDEEANQSRTSGAPQQQVVNGWTANEFLGLMSEQLDQVGASTVDHRPAGLLLIVVLQVGLLTVTTTPEPPRPGRQPRSQDQM